MNRLIQVEEQLRRLSSRFCSPASAFAQIKKTETRLNMKNTTSFRFVVSRVLIVSLALSGVLAPELHAATITVQNNADGPANPANCPDSGCRLRDALAAASDGDTINFDSSFFAIPRTIALMSNALVVDKNVTISGPGLNGNQVYLLSISGANPAGTPIPVLKILNPAAQGIVEISGVAIQNGRADNDHGGGIFIHEGSSLRLNKSEVRNNTATFGNRRHHEPWLLRVDRLQGKMQHLYQWRRGHV